MGKLTVEMLAKYGVKAKPKSSMFKDLTNPSRWDTSWNTGNVARGALGVATLGQSEVLGIGDNVSGGVNSTIDRLSGEDAKKQAAAMEAQRQKQVAAATAGQAYTQGAVETGRGDIAGGSNQAIDAIYGGIAGGTQALYGGAGQAAEALGTGGGRMADLYGGGMGANFQADPGYQFRLQQGEDAIMRNFAARGGRGGGAAMKAILEHGQNFASNEYNNYAGRQMSLGGAADQADWQRQQALANVYQGTGQQAAGMYQGTGAQLAGLYSGTGQNLANLGMQGAQINAGLTQAQMGALAPQQMQQGPGTGQQLLGLGAMAAGAYFGGPGGAAAAKQATDATVNKPQTYAV